MADHYTYLHSLGLQDGDTQKFVTAVAVGVGLLVAGSQAAKALTLRRKRLGNEEGVVPESHISLPGFFDFFAEIFVAFQDSILGKENRKYLPLTATIFLFCLFANLLGLIPGFPAATTTVWVTVPLALLIFVSFNRYGIQENGVGGHIKHFAGPVWWLAVFMFPLEIFGALLRILTLNLRLYWNMSADHMVLGIFSEMTPYLVPVIFYGLGTFVSFMQAFVPTVLTMIYILLATQHGEEEHH
jgi:F-type H+-transporting ATPase subunit a